MMWLVRHPLEPQGPIFPGGKRMRGRKVGIEGEKKCRKPGGKGLEIVIVIIQQLKLVCLKGN